MKQADKIKELLLKKLNKNQGYLLTLGVFLIVSLCFHELGHAFFCKLSGGKATIEAINKISCSYNKDISHFSQINKLFGGLFSASLIFSLMLILKKSKAVIPAALAKKNKKIEKKGIIALINRIKLWGAVRIKENKKSIIAALVDIIIFQLANSAIEGYCQWYNLVNDSRAFSMLLLIIVILSRKLAQGQL